MRSVTAAVGLAGFAVLAAGRISTADHYVHPHSAPAGPMLPPAPVGGPVVVDGGPGGLSSLPTEYAPPYGVPSGQIYPPWMLERGPERGPERMPLTFLGPRPLSEPTVGPPVPARDRDAVRNNRLPFCGLPKVFPITEGDFDDPCHEGRNCNLCGRAPAGATTKVTRPPCAATPPDEKKTDPCAAERNAAGDKEKNGKVDEKGPEAVGKKPEQIVPPRATEVGGTPGAKSPSQERTSEPAAVKKAESTKTFIDPDFVYIFEGPASFPLPAFNLQGNQIPSEGVTIYEGMKLLCYRDGSFELLMNVTIPERPVTLHLQFTFQWAQAANKEATPPPFHQDQYRPFTITLPPIVVRPDRPWNPDEKPQLTHVVRHRGYSSALADAYCEFKRKLETCKDTPDLACRPWVTRNGVAKFGSVIPSSLGTSLYP